MSVLFMKRHGTNRRSRRNPRKPSSGDRSPNFSPSPSFPSTPRLNLRPGRSEDCLSPTPEECESLLDIPLHHVNHIAINIPPIIGESDTPEVDGGEKGGKKKKGCWTSIKDFYEDHKLNRFAAVILLIFYSLGGAAMFYWLENENFKTEQGVKHQFLDFVLDTASKKLEKVMREKSDLQTKLIAARDVLAWQENLLSPRTPPRIGWDSLWGGLFYVGTVYTSIGYGNIAPRTTAGRAVTIVYAAFGIPLVLAILNEAGKFFCRLANRCWRCSRRLGRRLRALIRGERYVEETVTIDSSSLTSSGLTTAEERYQADSETMPVVMALVMCFGWILFCSGLFCIWEKRWSYGTSFYFFFISLSTIGFGDVVPDHPKMLILTFGLVIIGLSLVSMTVNVVQQKIEEWLFKVMQMIQEEYQKALEMGEGPEKEEILARIMKKQPWFMQKLMPAIMGEKQMQSLQQELEFQEEQMKTVTTNSKGAQTEPIFSDLSVAVQTGPPEVVEQATSPHSDPDWQQDRETSTAAPDYTDSITQVEPLAFRYITTQTMRPRLQDLPMQTSIVAATDAELQTSIIQNVVEDEQTQTVCAQLEDVAQQTQLVKMDDCKIQTTPDREFPPDTCDIGSQAASTTTTKDAGQQANLLLPENSVEQEPTDTKDCATQAGRRPPETIATAIQTPVAQLRNNIAQTALKVMMDDEMQTPIVDCQEQSVQTPKNLLPTQKILIPPPPPPESVMIASQTEEDETTERGTQTMGEKKLKRKLNTTGIGIQSDVIKMGSRAIQTMGQAGIPQVKETQTPRPLPLKRQKKIHDDASWIQGPVPAINLPDRKKISTSSQTNPECLVISFPTSIIRPRRESQVPKLKPFANDYVMETSSQTDSGYSSGGGTGPTGDLSDVECQTHDSYLKIARKLEALRVNRTKSLAVMTVPKIPGKYPKDKMPNTINESTHSSRQSPAPNH